MCGAELEDFREGLSGLPLSIMTGDDGVRGSSVAELGDTGEDGEGLDGNGREESRVPEDGRGVVSTVRPKVLVAGGISPRPS